MEYQKEKERAERIEAGEVIEEDEEEEEWDPFEGTHTHTHMRACVRSNITHVN